MATMTFDVPDDIKEAFEQTLAGENANAIIAEFMRETTERARKRQRNQEAIARILERRQHAPTISEEEFRAAREEGRP